MARYLNRLRRATLLTLLVIGCAPGALQAQISKIGPTFAVGTGSRSSDVAFDPVNNVYLVVWGRYGGTTVAGAFVGADGSLIGGPFKIPQTTAFTEFSGVAYSPDLGGFLVAWLDTRFGDKATVWGRLLAFQPGGTPAFPSNEFQISTAPGGASTKSPPAIAYSTGGQVFLVLWHQIGPNAGGGKDDIRGQQVSNTGTLVGGEIAVTNNSFWDDNPRVAYDSVHDEFYVIWADSQPISSTVEVAHVYGRRVKPVSGALLDGLTLLDQGGLLAVPQPQYDPVNDRFLVVWYSDAGAKVVYSRLVSWNNIALTAKLPVAVGYVSYDGMGLARNPVSQTSVAVFNGPDSASGNEDAGVEINAAGVPGLVILTTNTGSKLGNFTARIAANANAAQWLLSTSTSYSITSVQRLQSDTVGGGGGGTPPSPPPSTPPPTTDTRTLTLTTSVGGSVSGGGISCASGSCSGAVSLGATVKLSATPASGYVFSGWNGNSPDCFDGSVQMYFSITCGAKFKRVVSVTANFRSLDFDGAGTGDVFLYNPGNSQWFVAHNDLSTDFGYTGGVWAGGPWGVYPAHLNSDKLIDVFLYSKISGAWFQGINQGDGTFAYHTGAAWNAGYEIQVGKLDGDALEDLFIYHPATGDAFELLTNGAGGFKQAFYFKWNANWVVRLLNLNGDGLKDVFVYSKLFGDWVRGVNNGVGGFVFSSGLWFPDFELRIGNFNGDAYDDLFLYNANNGVYFTALNTGATWTYRNGQWNAGFRLFVGRFNGDMLDDIFIFEPISGDYYQALSDGGGGFTYRAAKFSAPSNGTPVGDWTIVVSDFNGDIYTDMLVYSPTTGEWFKGINNTVGGFHFFQGGWSPGWVLIADR